MSANSFEMWFQYTFDKLSLSECILWMIVGLVESIAIITLNLCTMIVFIKNPDLRVRSTYLLINLAVIDMLAGGFVTYGLFYLVGGHCDVWNTHLTEGWAYNIPEIFSEFFPISSLSNITLIALERLHAIDVSPAQASCAEEICVRKNNCRCLDYSKLGSNWSRSSCSIWRFCHSLFIIDFICWVVSFYYFCLLRVHCY